MGRGRDLAPTLFSARWQSLYLALGHQRRVPKKGPKLGVFTLVPIAQQISYITAVLGHQVCMNTALLVTPPLS